MYKVGIQINLLEVQQSGKASNIIDLLKNIILRSCDIDSCQYLNEKRFSIKRKNANIKNTIPQIPWVQSQRERIPVWAVCTKKANYSFPNGKKAKYLRRCTKARKTFLRSEPFLYVSFSSIPVKKN